MQEKDGEVKIVREQKAAADKELAALKMALFQAKENEERIAVEVKNLVNKELNQLKTEQKFQVGFHPKLQFPPKYPFFCDLRSKRLPT